jgi:hypothetical protein
MSLCISGGAASYRLLDVGYSISLDQARDLLAASAPERVRLVRGEAAALQIRNAPLSVVLGAERITVGGRQCEAEVAARIFDFGVISLRLIVAAPTDVSWEDYTAFGRAVDGEPQLQGVLEEYARRLFERIRPAIVRPGIAPVREDYVVFRIHSVRRGGGEPVGPTTLLEEIDVAPLLLNETRALHAEAESSLLQRRFSYYADDLALLTWDNALIIDPDTGTTDVEFILEFANAQLLELRFYDAVLDDELGKLFDRVQTFRRRRMPRFSRRYSDLLGDIQRLFADSTELVERVENALKVTDDVFLARVYSAALEIFRERAWRDGVYRKLTLVRESYEMLNAESQASRSEALEMAIVLLIVGEIVMAFIR